MANGCSKHEKFTLQGGCPAEVIERAKVAVPITVRAFSDVDDVELCCDGKPIVIKNSHITPGCPGAVSKFTVAQKMCIKIPIMFGADCDVGEGHAVYDMDDDSPCDCKRECDCD